MKQLVAFKNALENNKTNDIIVSGKTKVSFEGGIMVIEIKYSLYERIKQRLRR